MRIANLVQDSIVDGPGMRLTIFTQGCFHNCPSCHNRETHDQKGGSERGLEEMIALMSKNPLTEGLTLSGGEPFLQAADCAILAAAARERGLSVWVYTGYRYEGIVQAEREDWMALLRHTDVLVDGLFVEEEKSYSLPFRGSLNQRLIDVDASRKRGTVVSWQDKKPSLAHFAVPES